MESNMTFLCDMWRFSAEEYMQFLGRNGIQYIGVYIIFRNRIAIFVDEAKYLELSLNDQKFIQAEKQLIKLLEREEKLVDTYINFLSKMNERQGNMDSSSQQHDEHEEQD